jgi:N-acetylmuramoyl-L-alanine amidase
MTMALAAPTPTVPDDAHWLAMAMYAEASGEGSRGMEAVGHVVLNRAAKSGKSVKEVVLKRKQFSAFNPDDPNRGRAQRAADRADPVYLKAYRLADRLLSGRPQDLTGGATHYYNPAKANPEWAKSMVVTARIGDHLFLREPRKRRRPETPPDDRKLPSLRAANATEPAPANTPTLTRVMSKLADSIYGTDEERPT